MMRMRMVAVFAAGLQLVACNVPESQVSGGTSTDTEASIMGTVTMPDESPAAAARLRFRGTGYLSSLVDDSSASGDIVADSLGRFRFATGDAGPFDIEVATGGGLGALIRGVVPGRESRNMTTVVQPTGSCRLMLAEAAPGVAYSLRAFGLERYESADSAGSFRITLPAGTYRLLITGGEMDPPLLLENVEVVSGKEGLLDSLRFPKPDSGLLGYWPFEAGSGNVIADGSGNSRTGRALGVQWAGGKVGGAIGFSEGQGFVDLGAPAPNPFDFGRETDFTLAAWVKVGNKIPNRGVARRIISKQLSGIGYFLRVFPNGNPGLGSNPPKAAKGSAAPPVATRDLIAPIDVADGAWHHLAGVSSGGRLQIYVDGELRASAWRDSIKTVTTFENYDDKSPVKYPDAGLEGHLLLGCASSGQDGFDGLIDEVRIYDRAVTGPEMRLLSNGNQ